jgi:hypothetical protein
MGRRGGGTPDIAIENIATDAVKPIIVSSQFGFREIRGSSMTLREVI